MPRYETFVTNVGTVYEGPSQQAALIHFSTCKSRSEADYGPEAGQTVYVFRDGEVWREFIGELERQREDVEDYT